MALGLSWAGQGVWSRKPVPMRQRVVHGPDPESAPLSFKVAMAGPATDPYEGNAEMATLHTSDGHALQRPHLKRSMFLDVLVLWRWKPGLWVKLDKTLQSRSFSAWGFTLWTALQPMLPSTRPFREEGSQDYCLTSDRDSQITLPEQRALGVDRACLPGE